MTRFFSSLLPAALLTCAFLPAMAQVSLPTELATLPVELDRASGLEYVSDNSIWVLNDNGDNNVYEIDVQGNLLRTITITNAAAIDFEDLARDDAGNLYLGDFGNKNNNRQDLVIHKIPPPDQISGNTVVSETIQFIMPDQSEFPPPKAEQNFDIESMIHYNGNLYLFTKDRSLSAGTTKMYQLSDQPGQQFANLQGSFQTFSSMNGADLSPDGKTLLLIAENHFWVFYNFNGADFFGGGAVRIDLPLTTKKGVVFVENDEIYIVDSREENPTQGKLYGLEIPGIVNSVDETIEPVSVSVRPNPARDFVTFSAPEVSGFWQLEIIDLTGKVVRNESGNGPVSQSLDLSGLPRGMYLYRFPQGPAFTGKLILR